MTIIMVKEDNSNDDIILIIHDKEPEETSLFKWVGNFQQEGNQFELPKKDINNFW